MSVHKYNDFDNPEYEKNRLGVVDRTSVITKIIIANIIVYAVMVLISITGYGEFFVYTFGLVPEYTWSKGMIWQFLTHMFLHGGIGHIFWNMFVLWMIGKEVEKSWGSTEFLKFYFTTGAGAGIIATIFNLTMDGPIVGASGAIYGVLIAFGMMFPKRRIYLLFLIPIQARFLVIIMGLITFLSTVLERGGRTCYSAHLGGLIVGLLYILLRNSAKLPNINLPNINLN